MTTRDRMLKMIDRVPCATPVERQIAKWIVAGDDFPFDDDDYEAAIMDVMDEDDDNAAYMDALRRRWPEATDKDIRRGHNLAVAVAEVAKPN